MEGARGPPPYSPPRVSSIPPSILPSIQHPGHVDTAFWSSANLIKEWKRGLRELRERGMALGEGNTTCLGTRAGCMG